jgi:hypothetical protein
MDSALVFLYRVLRLQKEHGQPDVDKKSCLLIRANPLPSVLKAGVANWINRHFNPLETCLLNPKTTLLHLIPPILFFFIFLFSSPG